MLGSYTGQTRLMLSAKPLSVGLGVMLLIAFAMLTVAFAQDDFSVRYVAQNSNTALPMQYKISAVWGGHEGSLLLWVVILGMWTMAVSLLSKTLPLIMQARVLAVMGMIGVGFISFTLLTSNPFWRLLPEAALQGADLNPLLQDFGLIVHPPMLYMGYVGFSVAFAFAIAALLDGHYDAAWVRWSRPWTNIAWGFLSLGIMLGSWWAYYELGWGGWWFWDPVENASFMPWLAGTALMHSIAATEKRGVFRSWTLLLAILTFSLSLLGTFLVRSGILTSVHAFASDPERGIFILIFLGIVVGGSLLLFALRGPTMRSATTYSGWSRETMLLINNVFLVSSMAMILIGTLYPLLADVLDMGKISVGPPYFNIFFVPLMSGLMICLGFAGFTRWKNTEGRVLLHKGVIPSIVSLVMAFALPMFMVDKLSWSNYSLTAVVTLLLVLWVVTMSLEDLWLKSRGKLSSLSSLSGSYWGMLVAHIGLAVCALGVGLSTAYDAQTDLRMLPGDKAELGGYQFQFVGVERVEGPNFIAYRGNVEVKSGGELIVRLSPEKRNYTSGGQVMTEADIDGQLHRDLYVSLGEPLGNQAWAIRFQVKPFVRCIWLGGLLIGLGGLLAALDKRYRRRRLRKGADESSGGLVFE